jgi:pimeloyl-ACP methyl ester carboxylesterase
MLDARGHGRSDAPLYGYRYEDHAADVVALVEQLGLVGSTLLGHSMGGLTAALVASQICRNLHAVILADPTFLSPELQREVRDSDVADRQRCFLVSGKGDVLDDLMTRYPHRTPEIIELLAEARMQTRMSAFDVLTPPNPDYRDLMQKITVPAMLLIPDKGVVSRDTALELQTLNPRIQIEEIAGAGHGLHFDQPERFESAVRSFLASTTNV